MVGGLLTALLLYILPRFPCLSPDETSFGLAYNGGKIMTEPVTVSLLWLGTEWQKSGQQAIRNAITSLTSSRYHAKDSEVPTLGNWWEIIRQYRDGSNAPVTDRVDLGAECFYTGLQLHMTRDQVIGIGQSVFNMTSLDGFAGNLTCTQLFEVNDNAIYLLVFSHTVMFLPGEEQKQLTLFCSGDFEVEVSAGVNVTMAWARAPQNPDDECSTFFQGEFYLGPPNGDEQIDSLVGNTLAKIAEEVTDRDGRGWTSNDGNDWTVSSSCASILQGDKDGTPLFRDLKRNVSFNVIGLNGYRYIVRYIWDQNIMNCALKPSETCATNALMFKQPKGYINAGIIANHTNGLQPYPPNQKCQWKIQYPTSKFISFTINYFSVATDSNDQLVICESDSSSAQCSIFYSNNEKFNKNIKVMGSKAFVKFVSGNRVSSESRGWELRYSAGLCDGKKDIYDHEGAIGYKSATGLSYIEGLSCRWILHGKAGTVVTLSFTRINIMKDFDFLAVYNGTKQQMANFTGIYSGSNLPQMNLTGEVMIAFATQTEDGEGWSANFYIESPINRNRKTLIMVIIITLGVVAISFSLGLLALALVRRRRKHTNAMNLNGNSMLIRAEVYGEESRIGEGPSSIVYKAVSTDGISIAIKSPKQSTTRTDLEEEILLKTSHPNIISLVGYAEDSTRGRHLVFEYMGRGSLSWNLKENGGTLGWEKRLTVARQISLAIQMLHMYLKPPVYHGNITSENILLDEDYNAKLGGFRAANYCTHDGTNPEMPPEMAQDIWSFGLLLVELLKGEAAVDRNVSSEFSDSFEEINELLGGQEWLDPRLGIPEEERKIIGLAKLGEIAKWCISGNRGIGGDGSGPKIGEVASSLKQVEQLFCSAPS